MSEFQAPERSGIKKYTWVPWMNQQTKTLQMGKETQGLFVGGKAKFHLCACMYLQFEFVKILCVHSRNFS